jgi:hypothetical protein
VRAVLLADKTIPCPNKVGHELAPNGATCRQKALVGACATPTVARWRVCRKTRHTAPTDAKQRYGATDSAKKRQKEIAGANKRQSASVGAFFVAHRGDRRSCTPLQRNFRVRATFGGAEPSPQDLVDVTRLETI